MQVNPSEDLFCCTKKVTEETKTAMKQTAKIFLCECPAFSLVCVLLAVVQEQTKVVLDLWLQAHCVRDIFLAKSLIQ